MNVQSKLTKVTNPKILGEFIRAHRKEMNLSQVDLAGVSNVGVRFLSDLENGKSTVEFAKVLLVLQSIGFELVLKKKGWD